MFRLFLPDIRLQIAAVTLSEELNFTRAADRLRITQPALSKQIAELHSRLGFSVFLREQKKVRISEAGQVFIRGCKDSLAILEKAVRTARSTEEQIQPVITVGHGPYLDPSLMKALLGVYLPLYPNLRMRMESMFNHELAHGVLSAELDIAFIDEPLDNPLLTQVPLSTAPLHALLSSEHPAASRGTISIEDLNNIGWLIFPKKANPAIYDRILNAAKEASVTPVELHHYVAPQGVVQLIFENFGVAFLPKGIAEQLAGFDLVARPFANSALQITSYLVLRADQTSRLINEFGRAFLKRVAPNSHQDTATGQLPLDI